MATVISGKCMITCFFFVQSAHRSNNKCGRIKFTTWIYFTLNLVWKVSYSKDISTAKIASGFCVRVSISIQKHINYICGSYCTI